MSHISEYEVENILIDRLESIGYSFIKLNTYEDVLANFRAQLAEFNAKKLEEKGHAASFSDTEFNRIMIHMDNHSVYESAKILRDKYILQLDNGENVYLDFFSNDTDRNIYQVTHQVTMDKAHKEDVVYKNRYDVTVLITTPEDFDAVEAALADAGIETVVAKITMVPDTTIELAGDDAVKMQKMLDVLDDLDDVQNVYHNGILPDDEE